MAPRRNTGIDFVEYLQFDIVIKIMLLLDDPIDIIRASVVSRAWHHFVINNSLLKNLCVKSAPAISNIDYIVEEEDEASTVIDYRSRHPLSFEVLKRNHLMYSNLLQALSKGFITPSDVVECVVGASSTKSYPEESVINVILSSSRYAWGSSYWSSRGCHDRNAPEKIMFKLYGNVCIVTEIQIQPFRRLDDRVYSAKSVRFRMGHPKSHRDLRPNVESLPLVEINDDKYVWTYTSLEFPMLEEASLQSFRLPEPALCIGGYLQVELLGRAQKDLVNELYYICLRYIRILGHTLLPAFDIEMGLSGSLSLKYRPDAIEDALDFLPYDDNEYEDEDAFDPEEERPMLFVQLENMINLRRFPQ